MPAEFERAARSLSGLRAVVTGAAGGIGSAIARQLIAHGATVHGIDRDADGLSKLQQAARREASAHEASSREAFSAGSAPREAFVPYTVDLADRAALDGVLGELLTGLQGRCDILVNNAGMSRLRALEDTDDALLDAMFAVNFHAAFRITRRLLPALRASGRGAVVNIASELALVGTADYSAYCATKGALLAWSRALAVELAAHRIRVNAVCPGPIDTRLLREEFATHGNADGARRAEVAMIPLSRLGVPEDVAPVVAFLASDAAAFVTGAAWPVDGGKTAQ